ncbi:hypothetical protein PTTG_29011 [Puccinia triticina 1-1 BBBD Race 1]|uniref:Peptidase A2 domain-containing protein n=1 Tax=Puccinia triticina (isolate 1-1 / race 1 (BBBD)) TaxID=630390 RepID=A0A180G7P9_PUCT1|nr:hypothetical protein PTTG_29011 [Puccinia triticina 1-1 BBBD Race 1]
MSLPFSTLEMGEGFASSTPLRNRPLAGTSGLLWPSNATNNPPQPPRKDKGKGPENHFRDPAEEEMSDSDETQNNPPRNNTPRQQPTGYGIHNTEKNQENMYHPHFQQQQQQPQIPVQQPQPIYVYSQPEHSNKPNIIRNEEGLYYDGSQFMKFLHRFERVAYGYDATDREKAIQIPRFIRTEELKCELEEMEGYEEYDWTKLRADMVKTWGELDNTIMYTTEDLIKLAKQQSKSGISTHREYKEYLGKFTKFSISKDQLPKAKDGSNKAPKWEDLIAAAETEVRVDDSVYTNFSSFSESNRTMQKELDHKKGDGKRREQMLKETPNEKIVDQKKEGHSTYQCPEASKDKAQGLVRKEGKDWYLPNGEYIPWNPSRPIRSVVAAASANPQMQEAIKNLAESQQGGNGNTPTMKASVQTIHWSPPTLGAENFIKVHPITRSEAQKGRRGVRIQEPEQEAMDIDHEEEESDNTPKDTPKRTPEKVWSRERVPTILKKDSPEEALLQDLDNVKIPTTFAQLTTISPSYAEKIIARLQERLPGKSTSTTYIKTEATNISAPMTIPAEEEDLSDPCYYSCALGYVTAEVGGEKVDFMVDSGSMVNVIPQSVAEDLALESVIVNIPMQGVGGARCDITGVVENCSIQIGRFSGPAHLFISPKAQDCILGRPFLFDHGCTLEYHETGGTLTFQGSKGRRISVPLARTGQGRGWDNRKNLSTNVIRPAPPLDPLQEEGEEHCMFKKKSTQHFLGLPVAI